MPSNHKVQADCPNTGAAETLINGITYGKGSAMIKQLIYLIDWNTFCEGIKIYFNRHKWQNTVFSDFIQAMQEGYDKKNPEPEKKIDLAEWGKQWLQTKGMNKISIESTQESDKYTEFKLKQTPCQYADEVFRT